MAKLILWDDGVNGIELEGDINLVTHDRRVDDFKLQFDPRNTTVVHSSINPGNDWMWLNDFAIEALRYNNLLIVPVWKPNRYGQRADTNAFQHVVISPTSIEISVVANGDAKEVFDRYNPYEVPGKATKQILPYEPESHNIDDEAFSISELTDFID